MVAGKPGAEKRLELRMRCAQQVTCSCGRVLDCRTAKLTREGEVLCGHCRQAEAWKDVVHPVLGAVRHRRIIRTGQQQVRWSDGFSASNSPDADAEHQGYSTWSLRKGKRVIGQLHVVLPGQEGQTHRGPNQRRLAWDMTELAEQLLQLLIAARREG